jgi:hypothetical protein
LQNFSIRHYHLLLDSTLKDKLIPSYKSNVQNYDKLFTLEKLHDSHENSTQNKIKQKNSFHKYLTEILSGFGEKGKTVTMIESNSLDNFISTYSDLEDYCRLIKKKFELSLLILTSNGNLEKYYSVADVHLKFILKWGTLFLKCSTPSSALFGVRVVNTVPQIQLVHVL